MQVSVKHLPKSTVEITVTADAAELAPHRAAAIKEISQHVKIDGFRPGHIPEEKVIERVGEGTILQETIDRAVKKLYADAVVQEKLEVVSRPDVKVESVEPLKFIATVAVLPEVKIGEYKKITLKKPVTEPTDEEVKGFISELTKRHATATKVEGRAAKKGDRVEVDFAGFTPDGVPLDNTESKNHPITLGESNFIPGFEEGIIGMSVGEEKSVELTFPVEYHAKHLAGKPVVFKFKLNQIEEMTPPALDDEFAKKFEKETWKEVEADICGYLVEEKKHGAQHTLEDELIGKLLELTTVEIPESLIEDEVSHMQADLRRQLSQGGLSWEQYLEHAKKTEDDVKKEMQPEAEKRVKVRLMINKLIELENPQVSDEDMKTELEHMRMHGQIGDTMPDSLSAEGQRLAHQLRVLKLLKDLTTSLAK